MAKRKKRPSRYAKSLPTAQQKEFIDNYLADRKKNATQAAIKAGYSKASASTQASQLLKKPYVQEYLEEREAELRQGLQEEFFFDALEARKVMYRIMNDEEARDVDRLNAAKEFLDRAGFKATERVDLSGGVDIKVGWFDGD